MVTLTRGQSGHMNRLSAHQTLTEKRAQSQYLTEAGPYIAQLWAFRASLRMAIMEDKKYVSVQSGDQENSGPNWFPVGPPGWHIV